MLPQDVRDRVRSYLQHQGRKDNEAITELVAASQDKFLETIAGVDEDTAARKPAPDEWSLRELIRHVVSAENGVARLVETLPRGKTMDGTERSAGMQPPDDGRTFADYVADVRAANALLLGRIAALGPDDDVTTTAPHPFFGELNCREWAVFQRVHDEDHAQHAAKIIAAVG